MLKLSLIFLPLVLVSCQRVVQRQPENPNNAFRTRSTFFGDGPSPDQSRQEFNRAIDSQPLRPNAFHFAPLTQQIQIPQQGQRQSAFFADPSLSFSSNQRPSVNRFQGGSSNTNGGTINRFQTENNNGARFQDQSNIGGGGSINRFQGGSNGGFDAPNFQPERRFPPSSPQGERRVFEQQPQEELNGQRILSGGGLPASQSPFPQEPQTFAQENEPLRITRPRTPPQSPFRRRPAAPQQIPNNASPVEEETLPNTPRTTQVRGGQPTPPFRRIERPLPPRQRVAPETQQEEAATFLEEGGAVEEEVTPKPAPYSFQYKVDDRIEDQTQARYEVRENGKVEGVYSYSDGHSQRTVHYVADEGGFRIVKTDVKPLGGVKRNLVDGQAYVAQQFDGGLSEYQVRAEEIYPLKEEVQNEKATFGTEDLNLRSNFFRNTARDQNNNQQQQNTQQQPQ